MRNAIKTIVNSIKMKTQHVKKCRSILHYLFFCYIRSLKHHHPFRWNA